MKHFICFLLSLGVLFSCTNEDLNELELNSKLSLVAPNGEVISSSIFDLENDIAIVMSESMEKDVKIAVREIEYLPLKMGFVATVSFTIDNKKEGKIIKTNIIPNDISNESDVRVINSFNRVMTRTENSISIGSKEDGSAMLITCYHPSDDCNCTPHAWSNNGSISYTCTKYCDDCMMIQNFK